MATGTQTAQQLRQDLQNELIIANQLLMLLNSELQEIKNFTDPGGEFETNVKQNATLIVKLANLKNIDIENVPAIVRNLTNEALTEEQNNTEFDMDVSIQ